MLQIKDAELIRKAKKVVHLHKASEHVKLGEVGCALISGKGKVYVGVSIDAACGIGFCAEHSAIASMVTNGEYQIKRIVAVLADGRILPPCGRCRELMYQVDEKNLDTDVIIGKNRTVKLRKLLPEPWQKRAKF